jgi:hypothetical protein
MRIATLSLLVGGLACAKNSANEEVGAARDTTRTDQSQPVTSKGDTLNKAIDSSAINRDPTPSTARQTVVDSSMSPEKADRSAADTSKTAR